MTCFVRENYVGFFLKSSAHMGYYLRNRLNEFTSYYGDGWTDTVTFEG